MAQPEDSPLSVLKEMVSDQKKMNLPSQAEDPQLVPLHNAVREYDRAVSELVIQVISGGAMETDHPAHIHAKAQAVNALLRDPGVQSNRKVDFYRSYSARLDQMLLLAEQVRQD